jgi:hypothetical protein
MPTGRHEHGVVAIKNNKTGAIRYQDDTGSADQSHFNAGNLGRDEEVFAIWHTHTFNGAYYLGGGKYEYFYSNPNMSPGDPAVYRALATDPAVRNNLYVVGPKFIWHYNPQSQVFVAVGSTSAYIGTKTYALPRRTW